MELSIRTKIIILIAAVAFMLLVPLVAMKFTQEVNWTLADFVVAGALLFGTGLTFVLVTKKGGDIPYRIAVGFALGSALFLVWSNLAVGLIGNENNPANLMYFGVLAVGINGAIISRLRPGGLAWTMFAMAFAQVLITLIALIVGMQHYPESSVAGILGVNGFFIELFVIAGLLFLHAAPSGHPEQTDGSRSHKTIGQGKMSTPDVISWIFGVTFVEIGILNLILVHPVPGMFYLLLSVAYVPLTNVFLTNRLGFSIPLAAKIVFGLIVLWGTLAVTDLAQIYRL